MVERLVEILGLMNGIREILRKEILREGEEELVMLIKDKERIL